MSGSPPIATRQRTSRFDSFVPDLDMGTLKLQTKKSRPIGGVVNSNLTRSGQKANPCRLCPTGVNMHVDEKRRAVLRSVAPQGPCFKMEDQKRKSFKAIL